MSALSKVIVPSIAGYAIYSYLGKQAKKKEQDLVKELYFEVEKSYRDFRYSGDIRDLGSHVEVLELHEIITKLKSN